jgi:peptide/nickel transport system permease protein
VALPRIDSLPGYAAQVTPSPLKKLAVVWELLRGYPVIPMSIVMIVMIIPAIFAPLVAPHAPKDGDLTKRLNPPFWVGAQISSLEAVDEIDRSNLRAQLVLKDAQAMVDSGNARIESGNTVVRDGDKIVKLKTVVEETPPGGGAPNEIALKDAEGFVDRGRMQVPGDGPVVVGGKVEEITTAGGTSTFLLGTDDLGRDILSRIIYGSRISIVVAAIAIFIAGTLGTSLGISSGFFGSWLDALIMRAVDVSLSIPTILLALVLVSALGASFATVITVLVLLLWAHYARMARGVTLSVRSADFIARARVAGCSNIRIMIKLIFPNVFNSLVVLATLQVGFVIVIESTLSFLGAGIPRPNPAWGLMVADGRALIVSHWWVAFFPGLAILLVVLSMNLMGDWLRDKLDPRQRQV